MYETHYKRIEKYVECYFVFLCIIVLKMLLLVYFDLVGEKGFFTPVIIKVQPCDRHEECSPIPLTFLWYN